MHPIIQAEIDEFRKEYQKAYKNVFDEEVLKQGNKWFEDFLIATLLRQKITFHKEEIERLEEDIIRYQYYEDDCCDVCDYLIHSGESHQCEVYNSALEDSIFHHRLELKKAKEELTSTK